MQGKQYKHKRGVTLIELLIALAILAIISAIVVSPFNSFRLTGALQGDVENVLSFINKARLNTLSSQNDSEYGVHFESGRVVLFKGPTFTEPNPDNEELTFVAGIEASTISLTSGVSDVVFERLTGTANATGTVIISAVSDPSISRTLNIYGTGVTDIE